MQDISFESTQPLCLLQFFIFLNMIVIIHEENVTPLYASQWHLVATLQIATNWTPVVLPVPTVAEMNPRTLKGSL